MNHKGSSKSFRSDRMHQVKAEELLQKQSQEKTLMKITSTDTKHQTLVAPSDKGEYCNFSLLEMTEVQKSNEMLQTKVMSL